MCPISSDAVGPASCNDESVVGGRSCTERLEVAHKKGFRVTSCDSQGTGWALLFGGVRLEKASPLDIGRCSQDQLVSCPKVLTVQSYTELWGFQASQNSTVELKTGAPGAVSGILGAFLIKFLGLAWESQISSRSKRLLRKSTRSKAGSSPSSESFPEGSQRLWSWFLQNQTGRSACVAFGCGERNIDS